MEESIGSNSSEEFFDAISEQTQDVDVKMNLNMSLEEAQLAIYYFFDNRFDEARCILKPFAETSLYHSMGYATFAFLEAILTFDHIDEASLALKKCVELCESLRKKSTLTESIGNTFKRNNFNSLTELQCHAELCLAEALLMSAFLNFLEGENLSGLIRASLKVRQCFNCYRFCSSIMKHRIWNASSMDSKAHFKSGVLMGIGSFNLMMSMLPGRIVQLLKFIGFSTNRNNGLSDLQTGYHGKGLRQGLCALTVLGYYLIVVPLTSEWQSDENLNYCNDILTTLLAKHPNGVWMLYFKGRYELVCGKLKEAETWFLKSWRSQNAWPQFHYFSFWELLWVNCMQGKWIEAEFYARQLLEKSNWSKSIYAYQLAAVMLMSYSRSEADMREIDRFMLEVPASVQRIAGKSLPMEKFIAKRAARYRAQQSRLVLPIIELLYLWNMFKFIGKDRHISNDFLRTINAELSLLESPLPADLLVYYPDNRALCLLLRGSCYLQMKNMELALVDFQEVMDQSGIIEDHFLIPYAYVEAALCHASKNRALAISMLKDAKKQFSKYALESRLHFRIHAALLDLNDNLENTK